MGDDGSFPPAVTSLNSPLNASLGLTWLGNNFFAGAGINWNLKLDGRSDFGSFEDRTGDGSRIPVPDWLPPRRARLHAAAAAAAPPAPAAPANRPPTVVARCEPCTVEVGKASTVTADASDPDGDTLTYRWTAPDGIADQPTARQTPWTAPMQEGPVQLTVQVNDGKGGTADSSVTIQVIRPAVREIVFEDVHFDFDRYSLRPEATRALDEAIKSLQDNSQLRIEVEGHTCNIGTAEYNLALGERRANAVRDIPDQPRHRRRSAALRQLRRGAAEARQLARGDPSSQPSCGAGRARAAVEGHMRFVHLYLVGYFILVIGALAALWAGGILQRISGTWLAIGLLIAVGLGVMLSDQCGQAGHHSRVVTEDEARPGNGRVSHRCDSRPFFSESPDVQTQFIWHWL